jgi:hypothetical protein
VKNLIPLSLFFLCCVARAATGSVQTVNCTTGTATDSYTCTITGVGAGHGLIVAAASSGNTDITNSGIPSVSDNQSDAFNLIPFWYATADVPIGVNTWFVNSAAGGSTTLTFASSATQTWDVWITETVGLAPVNASVQQSREFFDVNSASSFSTFGMDFPVQGGQYYVWAMGMDASSPHENCLSVTGGANWTEEGNGVGTDAYARAVWDSVYNGSIGSVIPGLEGVACGLASGTLVDGQMIALAFSTAVQNPPPPVRQVTNGGTAGTTETGTSKQFTINVNVGDVILATGGCAESGSATTISGISDTLGNTWTLRQGTLGSTWYGVWTGAITTGGQDTVSMSCTSSVYPTLNLMDLFNISGIDQQCNSNSSSTTVTCSVTTTGANDFVVYYLISQVNSSDISVNSLTSGVLMNTSASHTMCGYSFYAASGAAGTYSSSFGNAAGGGTEYVDSGIIAFNSSVNPSGSALTGVVSGGVVR